MYVVVLPGLDGTGDLLEEFRAAAPAGVACSIVRYPVDARLGYDELERLADAQLPREGRVVLVGESFSGPVAVRLAARLGERVVALVLCNSFVTPPRPRWLRVFARAAVFRIRLPEWVLAAVMLAPLAEPRLVAELARALRRVHPGVLAHRVRELLGVDERAALRRVTAPIVYLRGTADRLVADGAVAAITATVPSVEVREIAAPHALLQTAPGEAWAAIAGAG